ncbi:MAG TPA: hypothetical protein VEO54_27410 [Thermoanaerobaculia bacterium]|nr:hypothetical protein [Thermoanaerobaculia bacterium]
MILSLLLQTLCLVAAGYALWRLWAVIARRGPLISLVVALGFVGRSLAGQALFWVSYLKLPYGRSLQLGDGLWFFGLDAIHYYGAAKTAAYDGLGAVLTISHFVPSVVYVKVVGLFLWLFGIATSTAILVNLAAYLGTAALIVVCAERRRVSPRITALTLAAVSFLPSTVLWSLQPLKDAFVLFLAVLFAFMVDEFAAAWRGEAGRARTLRLLFAAAMLAATTYALAGIRWYYALIMLAAASIPLLAIILGAHGGRSIAIRTAVMAVLMVVLTQNVVAGAGPYLPLRMRAVLRPWTEGGGGIVQRIDAVGEVVVQSRENFDHYKGAGTRIRAGAAVAEKEKEATQVATATAPSAPAPAVTATAPAPQPVPPAPQPQPAKEVDVPTTAGGRLTAGLAALLLPRKVASALGLVSIGGGRGLMWFVDIDTVLFNIVLVALVVIFFIGLRRGAWRDSFVWYLVVATIVITAALAYTVSNFGTLFRHRQMVVATLALIGIAAARPRPNALT